VFAFTSLSFIFTYLITVLKVVLQTWKTRCPHQGRTQGGVLGLKPPLELDILQKFYYLRKEINCFRMLFAC